MSAVPAVPTMHKEHHKWAEQKDGKGQKAQHMSSMFSSEKKGSYSEENE